jgi:hypothetical protein
MDGCIMVASVMGLVGLIDGQFGDLCLVSHELWRLLQREDGHSYITHKSRLV